MLMAEVWQGLLIPFLGTSLGAACVYIMKKDLNYRVQKVLYSCDKFPCLVNRLPTIRAKIG